MSASHPILRHATVCLLLLFWLGSGCDQMKEQSDKSSGSTAEIDTASPSAVPSRGPASLPEPTPALPGAAPGAAAKPGNLPDMAKEEIVRMEARDLTLKETVIRTEMSMVRDIPAMTSAAAATVYTDPLVPAEIQPPTPTPEKVATGRIRLYFATLRQFTESPIPPKWFNGEVNTAPDPMTYGSCLVTIPIHRHTAGNVEKKAGLMDYLLLRDPNDSERYVVVYRPNIMKANVFMANLASEIRQRSEKDKTLLLFIHGFNNTFDDAASRLAVLVHDMEFDGLPVLFSWPSIGGNMGSLAYVREGEQAEHAFDRFPAFLSAVAKIVRDAGARRVHIIAHSMGNRVLVAGLERLAREGHTRVVNEVIMAAPDVKAERFEIDIWPHIRNAADRFTIYASNSDRALTLSNQLRKMARLGEIPTPPGNPFVAEGADTIDASAADFTTWGLNHSYFGGPTVTRDLLQVLDQHLPSHSNRRLIEKVRIGNLPLWTFPAIGGG